MLFDHFGFLTLLHPREFVFFSGQQLDVSSVFHTSSCSQPAVAGTVLYVASEQPASPAPGKREGAATSGQVRERLVVNTW